MPYSRQLFLLGLLVLSLALPIDLSAGEAGRTSPVDRPPTYKPPALGAPSPNILVGGGTRTSGSEDQQDADSEGGLAVVALAPKQIGLTASPEPTLFWWTKSSSPVIVTIGITTQSASVKFNFPERRKTTAKELPDLGRVPLASQGFRLKKNVEYQWTVAPIGGRRATPQSSGTLVYREPSAELREKLARADHLGRSRLYAEASYWYDAVQMLWESIESDPQNSRMQRGLLVKLLADTELELPGLGEGLPALERPTTSSGQ